MNDTRYNILPVGRCWQDGALSRDPHVEVFLGNHYLVPGETVCLSGSIADAWPHGMGCSIWAATLHRFFSTSTLNDRLRKVYINAVDPV